MNSVKPASQWLKTPAMAGRLLCAALIICAALLPLSVAQAVDCQSRLVYSVNGNDTQTTQVMPTAVTHEFDSGARWEYCLSFDTHSGLVFNNLSYAAPDEPLREILSEASLGQILFKYDEDTEASHVLSDNEIGAADLMPTGPGFCDDGALVSVPGTHGSSNICQRQRAVNTMIQINDNTPVIRHEMSVHSWAQVGTFIYQSIWRFSEDGEITPALHLQGRLSRFTADRRYGTPINGRDRFASHATLVANWRLDFNIGGNSSPDVIEEIEFPGIVSIDGLRRPISRLEVLTESFRRVDRDLFRGWLIRDSEISSVEVADTEAPPSGIGISNTPTISAPVGNGSTRIGYYLDPQTSGYSYLSRRYNWPTFDLAVTRANDCERLASFNTGRAGGCAISLDFFANGESLANEDTVVWFSLVRHLVPRSEDTPAIGSLAAEFKMIPFDWSRYTPFDPPANQP